MDKGIGFYDFSKREVIDLEDRALEYSGCYFDRAGTARRNLNNGQHNGEWKIQEKINNNEEGYFDFSTNMIDIGAYVGVYRWNLPFQKAWLFEPNKESYMICCANAVLYKRVQDTFIYNEALSNKHEIITFNGYEAVDTEMLGEPDDWDVWTYDHPVRMATRTLDDHINEFDDIGFIKVDCEGMDWKVLAGGEKTIKIFDYPPILFENWPSRDSQFYPHWLGESELREKERNIKKVLWGLGYDILWEWGDHETHLAIHKDQ